MPLKYEVFLQDPQCLFCYKFYRQEPMIDRRGDKDLALTGNPEQALRVKRGPGQQPEQIAAGHEEIMTCLW